MSLVAVVCAACGSPADPGAPGFDPPSRFDQAIRSFEGKPAVVNYWATWCTPCKAEMPRIVAAARKYRGRVHFLGVNVEDDAELAETFARSYHMPFRSVSDPKGQIRKDQDILGLPVTQFYGADTELAFVHQGEIKADELDEKIEEIMRISRGSTADDRGG